MVDTDGGQSSGPFPPIIQAGAIIFVLLLLGSFVISALPTAVGAIGDEAVIEENGHRQDDISEDQLQTNTMAFHLIDLAPLLAIVFGLAGAIAVGSTTAGQPRPVAISVGVGMLLGGVCFVMVVTGLASEQFQPASSGPVSLDMIRRRHASYEAGLWYKPIGALKSGLTVSVPTALGGGAIAGAIRVLRD